MFYSSKLKKFRHIKHCFFSRKGGSSKGLYKSLNCGRGSRDNKKNISKNLSSVAKVFSIKKNKLILMHQTHSNKVVEIKKDNFNKKIYADAIFTKVKGLALAVVTADCAPILFYEKKNNIIASIHAGWRGAFSNIIKRTVTKMKKNTSSNDIYACIGPCIGRKSYEVDKIFFKNFLSKSKKNKRYFFKKNKNKMQFDLRKFISDKFLELNVKIDHVNYDTFKEKNIFFSYRRSRIQKETDYGRCISVIRLN